MRTLIASDLHLGSSSGADVLRLPGPRAALIDALADVDRLVLLGDVLELRHGPRRTALQAAEPVIRELGAAMAGGEIVLLAGNHDHCLLERFFARRTERPDPPALGVQQLLAPEDASEMALTLSGWAAPARVRLAHPGIWLREDVYATHGHYLDCHITVPTMERLAVAAMGRMLAKPLAGIESVDDYEAVTAPVYAWVEALAAQGPTRSALNGTATVRMWQALGGDGPRRPGLPRAGRRRRPQPRALLRERAVRWGFPLAVPAINRIGLGPVSADISGARLRAAALSAMGEVAARLGVGDAHVIFGHTHRAGPLPGDALHEWRGRLGARLANCGSWTYSPSFMGATPGESPYWPGACVIVDDEGPPRPVRLLSSFGHAELSGGGGAAHAEGARRSTGGGSSSTGGAAHAEGARRSTRPG